MKNGMYYRSNQEEAIDVLCDECESKSKHDYSPWEPIKRTDDEVCGICGLPVCTNDYRPRQKVKDKIRIVAAVVHHKTNEVEIVIEKTISAKVTMTTERNRLSDSIEELLANTEDPIVEKETLHSMWIDCEELFSI